MIDVAYFHKLDGADGATTNADRLCRAFHGSDRISVTAVHIEGSPAPVVAWSDEHDYPALYPPSFKDGIEKVDPDIVFVHGYTPELIEYIGETAPEDNRIYVFRNGVNTLEQWLMLSRHQDPDRVIAPIDGLDVFDAIVAPSHAAAERLKFHYGADCPHLSMAPCVVDVDAYGPEPFRQDGPLKVLTASRISANNYLLAPILAVRRLVEEIDIEMTVLGGGLSAYNETVHRVASNIEAVNLAGHVPAEEVRAYMQIADCVCIPSVSQQAVPTAAVEAMAAGNVVLSADYHTAYEDDTMIRAPLDHPPAWYDALADVAEDEDAARERIRMGFKSAKNYDSRHVTRESYEPLFKLLVAERGMDDE